MNVLIIYHSKYGSTKAYADYLGAALKATQVPYKALKQSNIDEADIIVIGSAVYIDSMKGMDVLKKYDFNAKPFYCFGVGLTEPTEDYTISMKNKYFSGTDLTCEAFMMLSGKLDVSTLKLRHRALLKSVAAMLKKKKEPLTDKESGIVEAVSTPIDHINLNQIDQLIEMITQKSHEKD